MADDTPSRQSRQRAARERDEPERLEPVRIGVLSDTHGHLDAQVLELFAGVDHIIHAGDIMDGEILTRLRELAPVTAVMGNLDLPETVGNLPIEASGQVGEVRFMVRHKPKKLLKRLGDGRLSAADVDLVVWGHTHVPDAHWVQGVLHVNPGTASSPEEEDDGPTVALLEQTPTGLSVRFLPLADRRAKPLRQAA